MRTETEQGILEAVAEEAEIDVSEIDVQTSLHDLGIDSLSALEILVVLEERYDVRIPEEALKDTSSVSEIVRTFQAALRSKEDDR